MSEKLSKTSAPFIDYLQSRMDERSVLASRMAFAEPDTVAIIMVDIINGFLRMGPLASPRVEKIVPHVTAVLQTAWKAGVRKIVHATDSHDPFAVEFDNYPPHCIKGTSESEPVDELKALPFADAIEIIPKNSISSGINTALEDWVVVHPEVETYIVMGDVTDLCVYQLAMYLRLDANSRQLKRRIIVPQNCVETYDTSLKTAAEIGAPPHDADLLHAVFLYHMEINGIEVVREIQ